jgi:hypothetical protein
MPRWPWSHTQSDGEAPGPHEDHEPEFQVEAPTNNTPHGEPSTELPHALLTYKMQLQLLEQQNKKRVQIARREQSYMDSLSKPTAVQQVRRDERPSHDSTVLPIPNRREARMRCGGMVWVMHSPPPAGSTMLRDYQMQLMLLEQQNKRRIAMARIEQHALASQDRQTLVDTKDRQGTRQVESQTPAQKTMPMPSVTLEHHQMASTLPEQENKNRLMIERCE